MAGILDPISIGSMKLPHRYYFAPAGTCIATKDGDMTERAVANMEAIGKGMAGGLVTWALFYIHKMGRSFSGIFSIEHDNYIRPIGLAVERIHLTGAKVAPMIFHGGALGRGWTTGQGYAVSSSDMTSFFDPNEKVKALTEKEIHEVIKQYAEAARRAKKAGFDAIYLHACHGSLIQQFHSPRMNSRKDKWGKEPTLFGKCVIGEIKNVIGSDIPLIVRYSADEFMPNNSGYDIEYGVNVLTPEYMSAGSDAICVSAGRIGLASGERTIPCIYRPYGVNLELARRVKEKLLALGKPEIPVLHAGKFFDHKYSEKVVSDKVIDMVGLCRPIIADVDAVKKRIHGLFDEERKCLCCNLCTTTVAFQDNTASKCAVNSQYCREIENKDIGTTDSKRVMVVGGGPAGMEAARISAKRGHKVVLFEKGDKLGGLVDIAASIPKLNTSSLRHIVKYLRKQMEHPRIEVRLNTEVNREQIEDAIRNNLYDAVIIATGSRIDKPAIDGIDRALVVSYEEYLSNDTKITGNTIAVIGAQEGAEIAASLAREGKTVYLIDESERIGATAYLHDPFRVMVLTEYLTVSNIIRYPNMNVVKINDDGILLVNKANERKELKVDNVIYAPKRVQCDGIYEDLKYKFKDLYLVGDAIVPGHIGDAIHSAGWVARDI
jgi:2,4-dienoyl-CoA reductase-like NADH-dependent reductase (Old Yellow Enzyme family)/thioredoxin reductase